MSIQLALATDAAHPGVYPDDAYFVATLARLGVHGVPCTWNDPDLDWTRFDAVLVRTVWDYFQRYTEFLHWLDQLDALGVPTVNDSRLLRWNSDKRYLLELARLGVEIIPTRLAHTAELPATLQALRAQEVVVKPAVSGGAWRTLRGTAGDAAFAQAVAALPEGDWLVQPFVAEIQRDGEWSLLFFDGDYSHAVRKLPKPGDYRVQGEHGGSVELAEAPAPALAAAQAVLAAVARAGHAETAYARIDGVMQGGRFLLMEAELIEPFLHLAMRPDAAERYAERLAARLANRVRRP
jgi:glutathione synthase/RimK-type ligase-like ATP-grasp enzyme